MKSIRLKSKGDLWLGIGSIVVLAILWSQTYKLKGQASMFPRLVIICGAVAALLVIVKAFTTKPVEKKNKGKMSLDIVLPAVCVFAFIVVMMLLAEVIGMYVCLFFSIAAISVSITVMESGWNGSKILLALLYDLVVIVLVYLLFSVFLEINMPKGMLI